MKLFHLSIIVISLTMMFVLKSASATCEEHLTLNPNAHVPGCMGFFSTPSIIVDVIVVLVVIGAGILIFKKLDQGKIKK